MSDDGPVTVPREVLDGIEAVRRSGAVNMLDRPQVIALADVMAFHATVLWIHENPGLYARGVFHGFRVVPEAGDPDA